MLGFRNILYQVSGTYMGLTAICHTAGVACCDPALIVFHCDPPCVPLVSGCCTESQAGFRGCARPNKPGVCTKITSCLPW